jgi:2-oxoglutarate ferredoxin oxidoreductase subunit delta
MAIEGVVEIKIENCKGCGRCTREDVCPKHALSIISGVTNKDGNPYVSWDSDRGCVACGNCFATCPDYCFTIYRKK